MPPRRQSHSAVRSVRTPEAIAALVERLARFDDAKREQGQAYLQDGAVTAVWSHADHLVKATVQGDTLRELTWFFTRDQWTNRCTCDVAVNCKHAYAAGFAWIAAVQAGARDGRDPGETTPTVAPPPPLRISSPAEHALETELARWLHALPDTEASALPDPGPLADFAGLRVRLDILGNWNVEHRPAPGKSWRAPSQRWLNDLVRLRPADLESLPPAEAALAAVLAAEARLSATGLSAKNALPVAAVTGLLRTTAARPAIVLPDQSPFTIEPAPLVFEATHDPADLDERFELTLVTPDGEPAEHAKLVATTPPPLYLFDQRVWRGPPPVPSKRLPAAALSDARLLPRLRAVGLRLPDSVTAELRLVTLRPELTCSLSPAIGDDDEREFRAQLVARASDPPCAQQWTNEAKGWRWMKNAEPPPRVVGEPALQFDTAAALEASARFGGFRLVWDGWAESWIRPVNDDFAEEFLAWHAQLPPGLDIKLSPELASLLGAPLEARVELGLAAAPDSEQDWFDLTVGLKVADTTLTPDEVALLLKARGKWVNLPRHGWRRVNAAAALDPATAGALDRLGLGIDDVLDGGKPTKHRLHALQLALEAESLAARDDLMVERLQQRAATIAATPPPDLPAGLVATLRPYQLEGYHFLSHLSAQGFGGILADDMGLGKTVQTLAWLLHLATEKQTSGIPNPKFRALVVCPKSVVHGWLNETTRFTPDLRIESFNPLTRFNPTAAHAPHLVVANYTQLRRHAAKFRSITWDAVVLDEGQFIKNPTSQVALAARGLNSRHRVVLTGTPIENRLSDLWSLFAFAQPGLLGDHTSFRRQYHESVPEALGRLHRRVRHFLLRRTKAQAAPDLPPRTEDEIVVELETPQRRLYDAELKRARAELLGVETSKALDAVRFHVLASLLRLRQICCHPGLVDPSHATLPSAKLEALLERVEELAEEGHQVLVFSQFVEMLKIIRDRLAAAGIGHLMLTGATENRAELVDTFQTDPSKTVFLLSLKAAGFGLNLTAASYAILYDPWWNPAAEAQAIDRIHRIGQTKPVIAYRLIAENTIEQKIRALQTEKASLAAAVVQEESLSTVLDLDSLRRILA